MKDIAVRRDLIVLKDAADFPPGEMDEPDLGLVLAEIVVFLLLFGLVKHHVTGGHDDFLPVEEEVPFSGRNIDDLPGDPALRPPCGEQRPGVQLISSGAEDAQGHFLFFERHSGTEEVSGVDVHVLKRNIVVFHSLVV